MINISFILLDFNLFLCTFAYVKGKPFHTNHFFTLYPSWKMLQNPLLITAIITTVIVLKRFDSVGFLPLVVVVIGVGLYYKGLELGKWKHH